MKLLKNVKRWKSKKSRRIAAGGASASMVVATLLGGLAVLVVALRDVRLRVELKRTSQRGGYAAEG